MPKKKDGGGGKAASGNIYGLAKLFFLVVVAVAVFQILTGNFSAFSLFGSYETVELSAPMKANEAVQQYFESWNARDYETMYSSISEGFKKLDSNASGATVFLKFIDSQNVSSVKVSEIKELNSSNLSSIIGYAVELALVNGTKQVLSGNYTLKFQLDGSGARWKIINPYGNKSNTNEGIASFEELCKRNSNKWGYEKKIANNTTVDGCLGCEADGNYICSSGEYLKFLDKKISSLAGMPDAKNFIDGNPGARLSVSFATPVSSLSVWKEFSEICAGFNESMSYQKLSLKSSKTGKRTTLWIENGTSRNACSIFAAVPTTTSTSTTTSTTTLPPTTTIQPITTTTTMPPTTTSSPTTTTINATTTSSSTSTSTSTTTSSSTTTTTTPPTSSTTSSSTTTTTLPAGSNPPQWNSTNQNTSTPSVGAGVLLSAFWSDDVALSAAVLETNETGSAQNKTNYSSPMALSGTSAWSNFSWQNSSLSAGTAVAWRIFANDSNGNWNVTNSSAFTIT